jgi:antitoxin component YwqK of YwqJK toxin-antitoxin module
MKPFLFLIIFASFTIGACQQENSKEGAINQKVNGLKEGKWVQYVNELDSVVMDTNTPCFREITFYRAGIPYGESARYYKSGKLFAKSTYVNGKPMSALKAYYESGALLFETAPIISGRQNGTAKWYFENGKLQTEIPYINGKVNGTKKIYYESGQLKEEDPKTDDEINGR